MNYTTEVLTSENWFCQFAMDTQLFRFKSKSLVNVLHRVQSETKEVPLHNICDFRVTQSLFYRGITLYVLDNEASIGEWRRVRKLRTPNTMFLRRSAFREMLKSVEHHAHVNRAKGQRSKGWFYLMED